MFRRIVLIVLAVGAVELSAIAAVGLWQRPQKSDLIVVFGNTVGSPRLAARLDTAATLYGAGLAPRIVVSGGIEPDGADEPAAMAASLVALGVPASAIARDATGRDTWATAHAVGPGARVIVVTQWFHVPRAMLAMRRAGVRDVSAAWPRFAEPRDAYSLLREAVALPVYALR